MLLIVLLSALALLSAIYVTCSQFLCPHPSLKTLPPLRHECPPPRVSKRRDARRVVLVTGANGFVGRRVVAQLKRLDAVTVIGTDLAGEHPCDIQDHSQVDALFEHLRPDLVVHVAGIVRLDNNYPLLHNVHLVGTQNILNASITYGVAHLVHTSSTVTIFSYLRPELDVTEDAPHARPYPLYYAATKARAEVLVQTASSASLQTCVLRFPGIYGLGDRLMVDMLALAPSCQAPGKGALIDYVYVENCAHAHVCAVRKLLFAPETLPSPCSVFHINNGDHIENHTLWNTLRRKCNPNARPLQNIPHAVAYVLALISEFITFLTNGCFTNTSPFFGLTRATLNSASESNTVDITRANTLLQYTPLFNTDQSLDHIASQIKTQNR